YDPEFTGCFRPVGTTDSERAFCVLLEHLRASFTERPPIEKICNAIRQKAKEIAKEGTFNFLLSNGEILIAHCSTDLHYLIRQHPFDKAELKDLDVTVDFKQVTTPKDRVAVIATEPLTQNEAWIKIEPGECMVFRNGAVAECYKD
ncbi:MAG: class II glutamine amidotransferase, partial [Sedimenticola sp.]|nr:class II glutamine amidotransferase [Sedimenticola sp.]